MTTITVNIKQENGRVVFEFYADCGKFGTEECLDYFDVTPEELLQILQRDEMNTLLRYTEGEL